MRATCAAGVGVRGHSPLLRGNTCVETARHGTANNRAIRDVGLHRERAFIREIAGSDFTDAGSRRTGMCGGVSERGGPASRSADAAIVRRSKARMLQSRSNPKRGCCNLEATRPEAQGRKS